VANSRAILETMIANLAQFMADGTVKYDLYRINPNELDAMQYTNRCRIALYDNGEQISERLGAYKAGATESSYGMDITVYRGYKGDPAEKAELILADYKDKVIDWAFNVQPSIVTAHKLQYFGYDGSTGITRLERSVTQTLRFISERFINSTQG
jgi:hypothetical protein